MSENVRFGELRSLLHQAGKPAGWEELCSLIDACDAHEYDERVLPYIQHQIERWPPTMRRCSDAWCRALGRGEDPPGLELVRHIELRDDAQADGAARSVRLERLERLSLDGVSAERLWALLEHPALAQVGELDVRRAGLDDEAARAIAHHPALGELRALRLEYNDIGPEGIWEIARSERLGPLEVLRLESNDPGPTSAEAFIHAPYRDFLSEFGIGGSYQQGDGLGWASIARMAEYGFFQRMRVIALPGNMIANVLGPAEALFPEVEELILAGNHLMNNGFDTLSRALETQRLRALELGRNSLSDVSLQSFELPVYATLERLGLFANQLTLDGFRRLLTMPNLSRLRELDLSYNRLSRGTLAGLEEVATTSLERLSLGGAELGDDTLYYLSRAEGLGALRTLRLFSTSLSARAARAIATSHTLRGLEFLDLSEASLGDAGVTALAEDGEFSGLRRLRLVRCGVSDDGVRALARAPWLASVRELELRENPLSEEGRRALYESPHLHDALRERFRPLSM